jgi:aminoglycoside phosphotransferase (APT) family kinase protein
MTRTDETKKAPGGMDVESLPSLLTYLRSRRLIGPEDVPGVEVLQGGVSNKTVLVEPHRQPPFVVKQALGKLRVAADWHCDPARIHREALGLRYLPGITPPGTITPLLFEDTDDHIIAMEAVPRGHRNWKTMLLEDGPRREHVLQFAEVLAAIHRYSFEEAENFRELFRDRVWFESLRLEPYYEYSGSQVAEARDFLAALVRDTRATQLALVHGDYSPKNVLIHGERFVLLDHEVAHFGDPAFDIGFSLTHLLSKAHHCRTRRKAFLESAALYIRRYQELIRTCDFGADYESRACRHTLACLLARVAGRSPLEYLDEAEKARQRKAVLALMTEPPTALVLLINSFQKEIACLESNG